MWNAATRSNKLASTLLKFAGANKRILAKKVRGSTYGGPANFALGADHGGFEMKEALKQYLLGRGLSVIDFGAKTKDPADDYPDFAQPAALAVAEGRAQLGLLVCTSGVGICITANKVAGIRAGVAEDEGEDALMRQHNDANVPVPERQENAAGNGEEDAGRVHQCEV